MEGNSEPNYNLNGQEMTQPQQPKKKTGLIVALIIVAVVLGSFAIGGMKYMAAKNNKILITTYDDYVEQIGKNKFLTMEMPVEELLYTGFIYEDDEGKQLGYYMGVVLDDMLIPIYLTNKEYDDLAEDEDGLFTITGSISDMKKDDYDVIAGEFIKEGLMTKEYPIIQPYYLEAQSPFDSVIIYFLWPFFLGAVVLRFAFRFGRRR